MQKTHQKLFNDLLEFIDFPITADRKYLLAKMVVSSILRSLPPVEMTKTEKVEMTEVMAF